MKRITKSVLLLFLLVVVRNDSSAQINADIVFITQPPNPTDFATANATFANHLASLESIPRGGDLYIRYQDGTLKNITQTAGYGSSGFQGSSGIAVRDPAVSFDGQKIIFSMVIGGASQQYQVDDYYWQLYEVTGIGKNQTPVITKVSNQPANFNNIMPQYGSDQQIIFISDRTRDGLRHLYPQRDEYESTDTNTGLWKLNPVNGSLAQLDHSPSGDFYPIIDSYGRIIFTRWDHLQRDQQAGGLTTYGAFDYATEDENASQSDAVEVFPEARNEYERDQDNTPNVNLHEFNHFFPWMIKQDGTELETLNHIGRHELHSYFERSFLDDDELEDFHTQALNRFNENPILNFHQIKEDPTRAGYYLGIDGPEFGTHASGQIVAMSAPPGLKADQISVDYLTHRSTSSTSDTPGVNHSGLYRDPVKLSDGSLLAAHTSATRQDSNIGTSANPQSRYDYRIKTLSKVGAYFQPSTNLTTGLSKNLSWYSPDELVSYNGVLWELQPVEIRSRTVPSITSFDLNAIEKSIFEDIGVNENTFRDYLVDENKALMVIRNATTRELRDEQQPYNLFVFGGVSSNTGSGANYQISDMEIFQGDLVRGYFSYGNLWSGRRVLARKLHDTNSLNTIRNGAASSTVEILEDGSVAAIVPARRALTWQLNNPEGKAVVRERYWLTFQPGEVRACDGCHGINSQNQLNQPAAENKAEALVKMLVKFQGGNYQVTPRVGLLALSIHKKRERNNVFASGAKGRLIAEAKNNTALGQTLNYRVTIGKYQCEQRRTVTLTASQNLIEKRLPKFSNKQNIKYHFNVADQAEQELGVKLKGQLGANKLSKKQLCRKLP